MGNGSDHIRLVEEIFFKTGRTGIRVDDVVKYFLGTRGKMN